MPVPTPTVNSDVTETMHNKSEHKKKKADLEEVEKESRKAKKMVEDEDDVKEKKEKKDHKKKDKEGKKEKSEKKDKKEEKKHKKDKEEKKDKKDKEEKKEKKDKEEKKDSKEDKHKAENGTKTAKNEKGQVISHKRKAMDDDLYSIETEAKKVKVDTEPVVILPVAEWRAKNRITVPPQTPEPYQSFEQLGDDMLKIIDTGLKRLQYTSPTPIQAQTWPIALAGKDMVGIAETGSGKTMAFLLPAIVRMSKLKSEHKLTGRRPSIVVMSPTRELAQQTNEVATKFLLGTGTKTACVYGGDAKSYQIRQLKAGAEIVIATPGRLFDLYGAGFVDFSEVFYTVLDEADRMLDMGFEPQIRQLFELMPKENRQTMMFTATFPKEIRSLAFSFQNNPVTLKIGDEDLTGNKNITQKVYVVEPFEKYAKLKEILTEIFVDNCRILIFANTKRACDAMAQRLWDEGLPVNAIHGDLDQHQRNKAMHQFKNGTLPILFATDVAARGLDVKGVKHVVNADFPNFFENYVHRIGRTGRGGESGEAHSLVCIDTDTSLSNLVEFLEQCKQEVPTALRDKFGRMGGGRGGSRFARGGRGGRGGRFGGGRRGGGGGGGGGFGGGMRSRFDKGGRGGGGGFRGGRGGSRGGRGGGGGAEFFA